MLSFAAYSSARVQQISPASARTEVQRFPMGRGLQRLSPLFTAFIATRQSLNPITKSNWENAGVEPDVKVEGEKALLEAHLLALRRIVERTADLKWENELRRPIEDLSKGQ
jgi:hypothetical protein